MRDTRAPAKWQYSTQAAVKRLRGALARVSSTYSPSGLLFAVVAGGALLLAIGSVIASYYGNDVVASLSFLSNDPACPGDDRVNSGVGVHCFGDYYQVVEFSLLPDPWANGRSNYAAAGMLPNRAIGYLGLFVGARVGLVIFLLLLIGCMIVPALWASRGKNVSIRLVTVGLFGVLAAPSLMAIDRGNNTGLAVPALLALLVAVRRDNWRAAGIAIVVAALVRPQFIILIAVLVAQRKWKLAAVTTAGVGATNLLAYLVYPSAFPGSLIDTLRNVRNFGSAIGLDSAYPSNVSMSKALFEVASLFAPESANDGISAVAGIAGTVLAALIVVALMVVGRRLPAHLASVIVLACASLAPSTSWSYYLVFALPVAAILLRDPLDEYRDPTRWHGVLDDERSSRLRVGAGAVIALATAASVARVLLPQTISTDVLGIEHRDNLVATTAVLAPVLWIAASICTLVAWARRERPSV